MPDRRTFLRGLASLPLIGGSVAILGQPTAAAVPVTPFLMADYADFLGLERWRVLSGLYGDLGAQRATCSLPCHGEQWEWHRTSGPPSTRASVVMATAGVTLTTRRRL